MKSKDKKPKKSRRPSKTRRPSTLSANLGHGCPIVGIGASAGGLEAFTELLKQLPVDTGFGFVLVQHLDPLHESALAQLLARTTPMPVLEATNNLRVEANHIYIIPPNATLGISGGILRLSPRSQNRVAHRSIDSFFEALAKDQRERAIGVILSGSATDGTMGLEAIKAEGGFTFAQDGSARCESMPRSAIAAGCVDLILSPGDIAKELDRIARHPYAAGSKADTTSPQGERHSLGSSYGKYQIPSRIRVAKGVGRVGLSALDAAPAAEPVTPLEQNAYREILALLLNHCGVDFSLYKPSTIHRRIARRTVLNRQPTLKKYAGFLRGNPKELAALYSDTLISVTSFFRNADAFAVLKKKVISKLLDEGGDDPIRIWVSGCSTGQEAYSIAIAYAEAAEEVSPSRKLQVFATDLNEANLAKARNGLYARTLVQDLSPERLRRFFVEEEGGFRVIKRLRESVVFARQNVISDPPFSRIDLISCRNLMIYLEPSLQKKMLLAFHYALKTGGFLFLGASESVGGFADLFSSVDRKQKIFCKRAAPTLPFHLPVKKQANYRATKPRPSRALASGAKAKGQAPEVIAGELSAEREADRMTVAHFAPPGVLINAHSQILQFRGATGAFLEAPTGKASFDLLRMAREGLMLPLRAAISSAVRENKTCRRENIPFKHNGVERTVNVEVVPLRNLNEPCFLVLFESAEPTSGGEHSTKGTSVPARNSGPKRGDDASRVASLERELSETRDYLQSVQERQEAANEELQASNEESQSANEELQSLNEELETSKEELESTNEELTTVNEEMASRNRELNQLMVRRKEDEAALRASDERFRALFDLGPVGVYSCDTSGRIREFNRYAVEIWGRKPKSGSMGDKFCGSMRMFRSDGTPMAHASCPMADVLSGKIPMARDLEVVIERPDKSRITVIVNIVPLKNGLGEITGAINCFYDVTERKRADDALRDAQTQLSIHADQLESLVVDRTFELTESNKKLETSVESNKKGKEEYQALFAESEVIQGKLRNVTHLVISAQEEERKNISRELHDEVVQTLIGINVELTSLGKGGAIGERALKKKLAHTQKLVEGSVNAVHRFARGLRPAVLDDLGLIPAIHAFCNSLIARQKLSIGITAFGGVEALEKEIKVALFRVAQEALTNVARHAHASRIKVNIIEIPKGIRMEISDNGGSFPVKKTLMAKNPKRLGLIGMKERIEMIGGSLTIESLKGIGTTIRADVPFDSVKDAQ